MVTKISLVETVSIKVILTDLKNINLETRNISWRHYIPSKMLYGSWTVIELKPSKGGAGIGCKQISWMENKTNERTPKRNSR